MRCGWWTRGRVVEVTSTMHFNHISITCPSHTHTPSHPRTQVEVPETLKPISRTLEKILLQPNYGDDDPSKSGHADMITDVLRCVFMCVSMVSRPIASHNDPLHRACTGTPILHRHPTNAPLHHHHPASHVSPTLRPNSTHVTNSWWSLSRSAFCRSRSRPGGATCFMSKTTRTVMSARRRCAIRTCSHAWRVTKRRMNMSYRTCRTRASPSLG